MRAWWIIYLRELRSYFLSPFAFIILSLFSFLNGWLFITLVGAMRLQAMPSSLVYNLFTSGWFWMGFLIPFPLITMRLFAEEKKMGTFEGLMTAPVRALEVLLGKYAAALTVYLAMLVPLFLFFHIFQAVTLQDGAFGKGALAGSALALVLTGSFNLAIGTLASALTSNQLIAAMMTFVGIMLHYFFGFFTAFTALPDSRWNAALSYVSTVEHVQTMSEGLIDSRPVVYYVSFTVLLLAVTHLVIESRKWRI